MDLQLGLSLGGVSSSLSSLLASILYQTNLGDFVYRTDDNRNVILDNQGGSASIYDGLLYSGRAIELGATNDVDIPIHHTLGADKDVQAFSATVGDDTGSASVLGQIATFNIVGNGTQATGARAEWRDSPFVVVPANTTYKIVIDIVVTSGAFTPNQFRYGERTVNVDVIGLIVNNQYTSSFTHEFEFTTGNEAALSQPIFLSRNDVAGSYTLEIQSIQQITNPNSYLTLYDFTNGFEYIDCSTLTPSTTYTVNSKTINNVLTHATEWSATDKAKIEGNPNLVGKLAIETLGATKTIPELDMVMDAGASADSYHMCSENSGAYLVDSRVAYGIEKYSNYNSTVFSPSVGTTVNNGGNSITVDVTTGNIARPWIKYDLLTGITAGKIYIVNMTAVKNSGADFIIKDIYLNGGASSNLLLNKTISTSETLTFLVRATSDFGTTEAFSFTTNTSLGPTNFDINNVSVREATATEIANYASNDSVRTNADLQQKGIQTTAFVTDGAGVPTAYSSNLLQFNGDGRYVDTQWIPSETEPVTVEAVMYPDDSGHFKYALGAYNGFKLLGLSSLNQPVFYWGSNINVSSPTPIAEATHIIGVFDGSNISIYVNGLHIATTAIITSTTAYPVFIGMPSFSDGTPDTTREIESPCGLPKIHKGKAFDATEVSTAYAQAKLIYPTLP